MIRFLGALTVTISLGLNPAPPYSTDFFTMQGFDAHITPKTTGCIMVDVSGWAITKAGAQPSGIEYQLSYGTGYSPANGGSLAGTQIGPLQSVLYPGVGPTKVEFSQSALIPNLEIGTNYWFDDAAEAIKVVGNVTLSDVKIKLTEREDCKS
jgi:hypothetical protein